MICDKYEIQRYLMFNIAITFLQWKKEEKPCQKFSILADFKIQIHSLLLYVHLDLCRLKQCQSEIDVWQSIFRKIENKTKYR